MGNVDKIMVGGVLYDIVSPSVFGDYIENIGSVCSNPSGYAMGSVFLAIDNGIQKLYQATAAITNSTVITVNTNCIQTTLEDALQGNSEIPDIKDDIDNLTSAITTMTNDLGAKNVLPFDIEILRAVNTSGTWSDRTYTSNQVAFTINDDLSISISGTATGGSAIFRYLDKTSPLGLPNGNYVFNGLPSEGSSSTFRARYATFQNGAGSGWTYQTSTDGSEITLSDVEAMQIDLVIYTNYQVPSGFVWKPMLRPASITDATYATPSKTNRQLTEDSVSWNDLSIANSINLLPNEAVTAVDRGVTFTVNSDGSVTCSGTNDGTGDSSLQICTNINTKLISGIYKVSGATADVNIQIREAGAGSSSLLTEDTIMSLPYTNGNSHVYLKVPSGTDLTTPVTVYPMIVPPSYNGDYVPYAKSNKELTDDVATVTDSAAQGVSAYGGTLAVSHTGVTANVATQIISKRGVYLVLFTFYDVASAVYLINVDSSDSSKCFASELAAPPSGVTITFDFSTAGKVKVTADHGYRVRVITIADANY